MCGSVAEMAAAAQLTHAASGKAGGRARAAAAAWCSLLIPPLYTPALLAHTHTDWIIEAAAFRVFELERPTPDRPFIAGLLDPCTNSKLAPNIPAETLYDKQVLYDTLCDKQVLYKTLYDKQVLYETMYDKQVLRAGWWGAGWDGGRSRAGPQHPHHTKPTPAPTCTPLQLPPLQDNGLKLSNSWAGHHVLLNPDYRAQVC